MCGHGTKGHGLMVGLGRSGWWLDLVTWRVFSNLDDSVSQRQCLFRSFSAALFVCLAMFKMHTDSDCRLKLEINHLGLKYVELFLCSCTYRISLIKFPQE